MKQYFSFPFHLLEISPWPLFLSFSVFNLVSLLVYYLKTLSSFGLYGVIGSLFSVIFIFILWMNDVTNESHEGNHVSSVKSTLKSGFFLFVISELLLFISLFWSFFWMSLNPDFELGSSWPPSGVSSIDWFGIPLVGTLLLISSSVTLTVAHSQFDNHQKSIFFLFLTIVMGLVFLSIQIWEYSQLSFTFADSSFGSVFFLLTGFHGFHVIIGVLFLICIFWKVAKKTILPYSWVAFDLSVLYWHFVDIIWIFVYFFVYIWGMM